MIDDKKIEEAARGAADLYEQDLPIMSYYEDTEVDGQHNFCQEFGAELFKDGVKWAINEFLKDLWHPASEKPNIKQGECCVTCLVKFKNGSTELCVYFRNPEGWVCDDMSPKDFKRNFKGWLYIDNLLPKKGGENEIKVHFLIRKIKKNGEPYQYANQAWGIDYFSLEKVVE